MKPTKSVLAVALCLLCSFFSCGGKLQKIEPFEPTNNQSVLHIQKLASQTVGIKIDARILVLEDGEIQAEFLKGSGTGVVIDVKVKKNVIKSLVLSVAHVCDPLKNKEFLAANVTIKTVSIDGKENNAKVVHVDHENDVCLLIANGKVGNIAEIANDEPEFGAQIEHIGADAGVFGKKVAIYTSGVFTGTITEDELNRTINSIIVYFGASGSALYHNGKVYSLVSATRSPPTSHITMGPRLSEIKKAIAFVTRSIWK